MTVITPAEPIPPRPAVIGVGSGLVLMAFFTLWWASLGPHAWPGGPGWVVLAIGIAAATAFVGGAVHLLRALPQFPKVDSVDDRARGRRMGLSFGAIFGVEGLLIGASSALLGAFGGNDYEVPVVALIVGLHFAPMARVFERTIDYYVSAWLTGVAVLGIVAVRLSWAAVPHVWGLVGVGAAGATITYGIFMLMIAADLLIRSSFDSET